MTAASLHVQPARDGQRDFDFLLGDWKTENRRRSLAVDGSSEWTGFESRSTVRALWGQTWATRSRGRPDQPTFGAFHEGRGEFYSHEPVQGRRCYLRIVWSNITPSACRWEQAFSEDGGRTWETHWVMEFTRIRPLA